MFGKISFRVLSVCTLTLISKWVLYITIRMDYVISTLAVSSLE